MEFRRIPGLPPYVFTIIDGLKVAARREGRDVVDLGFGNPDIPSPDIAVAKLAEADLYARRFEVTLDPDTEVLNTIGAKEGFCHLMWVLLQPGDSALVPSPSYPIHLWGPYLAGADTRQVSIGTDQSFVDNVMESWEYGWPQAPCRRAVLSAQPDDVHSGTRRPAATRGLGP